MSILQVAAHELGGKGPTLLMLHANGFHARAFLPMLPILTPHFRCVALDLPGHGVAPTPGEPFSMEDLLAAVRAYVDTHAIEDCYVVGHSLGGLLAALLQLERPGTFRAMFLFEPVMRSRQQLPHARGGAAAGGGGSGASPGGLLARMARKRQSVFASVEAAKAALGAKPPFSSFHPQALHAYLGCGGLRPVDPGAEAAPRPAADPASAPTASTRAADAADASGGTVTLACSPETEARVFEAVDPPPYRPWHRLTAPPDTNACRSGGGGAATGAGGGAAAGAGCRVAFAAGRDNAGVHGWLTRWTCEVAELVPGARLFRFPELQHLGPMEDPEGVARAALGFFLPTAATDGAGSPGSSAGSTVAAGGSGIGAGAGRQTVRRDPTAASDVAWGVVSGGSVGSSSAGLTAQVAVGSACLPQSRL